MFGACCHIHTSKHACVRVRFSLRPPFNKLSKGGTWGVEDPRNTRATHSEKRHGMRDAPAALSHLGSPFVNDSTELTALIFLRACHAQGTRADHLVSVPQTCDKPKLKLWRQNEINSSGSMNSVCVYACRPTSVALCAIRVKPFPFCARTRRPLAHALPSASAHFPGIVLHVHTCCLLPGAGHLAADDADDYAAAIGPDLQRSPS